MPVSSGESPNVFISYSHDSQIHMDRVLALANRLRDEGIDCHLDQYETSPNEGWTRWMVNQIESADFVLLVCTDEYNIRFRGKQIIGRGLGAKWEGAIITQEIYEAEANSNKFVPVLFVPEDATHIPIVLRGVTHYVLTSELDYEHLYRRLTNQPSVTRPKLGKLKAMPPRTRKVDFSSANVSNSESTDAARDPSPRRRARGLEHTRQNRLGNGRDGSSVGWAAIVVLLLVFAALLVYAFEFIPDTLPEYKQRVLALACAITAGLFGYFLTGSIGLVVTKAPLRFGSFSVKATGGFGLFALVLIWWLSPLAPVKPESPALTLYRVRATVLDPHGTPVDDAEVRSSLGGEPKKVAGGWEFDIPAVTKPVHGMLTIYAFQRRVFLQGQADLNLGNDPNPAVTVKLVKDESASVHGKVVDAHTTAPLADVWVNVVGHEDWRVKTGPKGEFPELPAHAGDGEPIRLHAEKIGYTPEDQVHYAGSEPALIDLRKK